VFIVLFLSELEIPHAVHEGRAATLRLRRAAATAGVGTSLDARRIFIAISSSLQETFRASLNEHSHRLPQPCQA